MAHAMAQARDAAGPHATRTGFHRRTVPNPPARARSTAASMLDFGWERPVPVRYTVPSSVLAAAG